MRDTLGAEGIAGIAVVLLAIGLVTVHDPVIGAGLLLLLAGLVLIVKGVADSVMHAFGLK